MMSAAMVRDEVRLAWTFGWEVRPAASGSVESQCAVKVCAGSLILTMKSDQVFRRP